MALVLKRVSLVLQHSGAAASGRRPPRRNHHVWPEEIKTHLNCREGELYVLVREMFEANEV